MTLIGPFLFSQVSFKPAFNVGKIARENASGTVEVDCFPLHVLLLALNVTRVDYFSLDVEGAELDVLRTVPFDRIDIRVGPRFESRRVHDSFTVEACHYIFMTRFVEMGGKDT